MYDQIICIVQMRGILHPLDAMCLQKQTISRKFLSLCLNFQAYTTHEYPTRNKMHMCFPPTIKKLMLHARGSSPPVLQDWFSGKAKFFWLAFGCEGGSFDFSLDYGKESLGPNVFVLGLVGPKVNKGFGLLEWTGAIVSQGVIVKSKRSCLLLQ